MNNLHLITKTVWSVYTPRSFLLFIALLTVFGWGPEVCASLGHWFFGLPNGQFGCDVAVSWNNLGYHYSETGTESWWGVVQEQSHCLLLKNQHLPIFQVVYSIETGLDVSPGGSLLWTRLGIMSLCAKGSQSILADGRQLCLDQFNTITPRFDGSYCRHSKEILSRY